MVVSSGIDTLHFTAPLEASLPARGRFEEMQMVSRYQHRENEAPRFAQEAQGAIANEAVLINLAGLVFECLPHGAKFYRWGFECKSHGVYIWVAKDHVKAQLGSFILWSLGPDEACRRIRQAVSELMDLPTSWASGSGWPAIPVRVDFCSDFQLEEGMSLDRSLLPYVLHRKGGSPNLVEDFAGRSFGGVRRFTGWQWGGGKPIMVRLYDKTIEIRDNSPEKVWFYDVWETSEAYRYALCPACGLEVSRKELCPGNHPAVSPEEVPVWRLEVELKGSYLSELHVEGEPISDVRILLDHAESIWLDLTGSDGTVAPRRRGWLELRTSDGPTPALHQRLDRAPLLPLWRMLQGARFGFSRAAGRAERIRSSASVALNQRMAAGCASTIASEMRLAERFQEEEGRAPTLAELQALAAKEIFAHCSPQEFFERVARKSAKAGRVVPLPTGETLRGVSTSTRPPIRPLPVSAD